MSPWVMYGYYLRSRVGPTSGTTWDSLLGGRFFVGDAEVAAFLTLGSGPGDAEFRDARTLVWHAKPANADPAKADRWFPVAARAAGKPYELFIRTIPSGPFLYAGSMAFAAINGATVEFTLSTPIPRELR